MNLTWDQLKVLAEEVSLFGSSYVTRACLNNVRNKDPNGRRESQRNLDEWTVLIHKIKDLSGSVNNVDIPVHLDLTLKDHSKIHGALSSVIEEHLQRIGRVIRVLQVLRLWAAEHAGELITSDDACCLLFPKEKNPGRSMNLGVFYEFIEELDLLGDWICTQETEDDDNYKIHIPEGGPENVDGGCVKERLLYKIRHHLDLLELVKKEIEGVGKIIVVSVSTSCVL